MATPRMTEEAAIQRRIDKAIQAIREMDLEQVMSTYACDIDLFDLGATLHYLGAHLKRAA